MFRLLVYLQDDVPKFYRKEFYYYLLSSDLFSAALSSSLLDPSSAASALDSSADLASASTFGSSCLALAVFSFCLFFELQHFLLHFLFLLQFESLLYIHIDQLHHLYLGLQPWLSFQKVLLNNKALLFLHHLF